MSKNFLFMKLLCRYALKTHYAKLDITCPRKLSTSPNTILKRYVYWTRTLGKDKDNISDTKNVDAKQGKGAKLNADDKHSVITGAAPVVKEAVEVVMENVKEQSLEKQESVPIDEQAKTSKEKVSEKIENKEPELDKKSTSKKRKKLDLAAQSLERNFITPFRAMSEFLLKPSDLENLPKTKRRSPYESEPPITVYWRRDVEAKAMEVWGSKEALSKELVKRDIERKKFQQNIFMVKRRLRDYRRETVGQNVDGVASGLMGRSGKVVLIAVGINAGNCLFKLFAWWFTGSQSMFSECVHSFADTLNQVILAFGIHKSIQLANSYHPYGYNNMKYVASLISGVGIFCVGTGLSVYHGISGLLHPHPPEDFFWAYFVLGGSLISEGATWLVALNSIKKGAKEVNSSVKEYILSSKDPSVNVVLLEDFAAVVSVVVAAGCMSISSVTNTPTADSFGCLLVGCILGSVASFIIYTNVAALVGRSISEDDLNKINGELESDVMVRAIHDVKGIDMGNYLVRYKAEVDFDGRELTRSYLDKQDLNVLLEECKKIDNIDDLEIFMLKHGENIVDSVGGEIDRIEMKLRKKHPQIRHCDLEIL
ncbi:hypothetical protein WA026_009585 [Henosepilachna vigintioctopunctata]|uniref:Proton-coupled zinc antiporter SLC30A9, mitochondrial n=1 Tax=Henosepilachna vigintioctopunctata TaxID=420089 RepID=A0AAW1U6L7_9CUCU